MKKKGRMSRSFRYTWLNRVITDGWTEGIEEEPDAARQVDRTIAENLSTEGLEIVAKTSRRSPVGRAKFFALVNGKRQLVARRSLHFLMIYMGRDDEGRRCSEVLLLRAKEFTQPVQGIDWPS